MKIFNLGAIALSSLLVGLAQTSAMGFSLDAFSDVEGTKVGQSVYQNRLIDPDEGTRIDKPTDSDTNLDNTVTGNNRHLNITIDPASDEDHEAQLRVNTNTSLLTLTTDTNITSTGILVWNGSNSINYSDLTQNASLNLDLEADEDGDDSIAVNINFADQGGTLDLTLYDGTDTYLYSQSIPVVQVNDPEQTLYYDFQTYENNSINVNSIQYISMSLSGPAASDIELNFLETAIKPVPFEFSPSLGLILGGSLFGFLNLQKKLKKSGS